MTQQAIQSTDLILTYSNWIIILQLQHQLVHQQVQRLQLQLRGNMDGFEKATQV